MHHEHTYIACCILPACMRWSVYFLFVLSCLFVCHMHTCALWFFFCVCVFSVGLKITHVKWRNGKVHVLSLLSFLHLPPFAFPFFFLLLLLVRSRGGIVVAFIILKVPAKRKGGSPPSRLFGIQSVWSRGVLFSYCLRAIDSFWTSLHLRNNKLNSSKNNNNSTISPKGKKPFSHCYC